MSGTATTRKGNSWGEPPMPPTAEEVEARNKEIWDGHKPTFRPEPPRETSAPGPAEPSVLDQAVQTIEAQRAEYETDVERNDDFVVEAYVPALIRLAEGRSSPEDHQHFCRAIDRFGLTRAEIDSHLEAVEAALRLTAEHGTFDSRNAELRKASDQLEALRKRQTEEKQAAVEAYHLADARLADAHSAAAKLRARALKMPLLFDTSVDPPRLKGQGV